LAADYFFFRRRWPGDDRVLAFVAAFRLRVASAAMSPRAVPAQAFAALSQMLSSGFLFVQGFGTMSRSAQRQTRS
jgi:hypothetical protein